MSVYRFGPQVSDGGFIVEFIDGKEVYVKQHGQLGDGRLGEDDIIVDVGEGSDLEEAVDQLLAVLKRLELNPQPLPP